LQDLTGSDLELSNLIEVTPGVILNRLIADVRNNMLLGPEVFRDKQGELEFSDKTLFRRVSGGYQRHFVTLWPLFEKLLPFEDLMNHLAAHARHLRDQSDTYFSTIVTCTATGHHLLEHLQPRIETSESRVEATYLGPYPYHALTQLPENAFKNKSVLILTDVIASMTLVKNIASVVHRLGGTVSAVLSVVTTLSNGEQAECEMEYAPNRTARVESFCTFDVQKVSELPDGFSSIDIDPETILPRDKTADSEVGYRLELQPRAFKPFDFPTTLKHFDQSRAMRLGIYEANNRYFTAGIRLPKLFQQFGYEIWQRIKPALKDQDLLVTTTDRDDLRFLDFVQRWVEPEYPGIKQLLIPRYDSLEFDFPYFLPESARTALSEKRVVLLIHSAQISEKLRRLVSLLAQSPVASVDVICLLNRMGDHSADFVARIKQMTSGIGEGRLRSHHRFSFHWVYMLYDLHSSDLVGTLESIRHLADVYTKSSPSPVFQSLFAEEMRYFRPQSFLNRTIENVPGVPLPAPVSLDFEGKKTQIESFDTLLYAWFAQERSLNQRNHQIRQLLVRQTEQAATYMVLLLILSEISFLRSQKNVAALKSEIKAAIASRRKQRLEMEDTRRSSASDSEEAIFLKIADIVLQETALLFSYALICYLDNFPEELIELRTTLTSGLSEDEWKSYPLNFQAYYGDSRTTWCVSLLLFFAHLERALTNEEFREKKEELIGLSRRFEAMIANDQIPVTPLFEENPKTLKRRLAYPFDALLMDLGAHALDSRENVLVFLNNRVGHRSHHNALCKDTKEALTILSSTRRKVAGAANSSPRHPVALPRSGETARQWTALVDKASEAAAILTIVGHAASDLFDWYRLAPKEEEERFRNPPTKDGFQSDVDLLRKLFSQVRQDSRVSAADLTLVMNAHQRIEGDLAADQNTFGNGGKPSTLRKAIDYYQPPIRKKIIEEMRSADKRLANECGAIWSAKADECESRLDHETDDLVLADPLLLAEILWNLLTNVRHGLTTLKDGGDAAENSSKVDCKINVFKPNENGGRDRANLRIEITSPANGSLEKPSTVDTWFRHEQEIKRYGGKLLYKWVNHGSFTATLDLIRMRRIEGAHDIQS